MTVANGSDVITKLSATAGTARTRDGRSITFAAIGREDGFPVVYCHGAIGSPRWRTVELDHVVQRLGFRYLMVNRPGFAGSDPSPGRSVADFGRDLEDVIDSLGYDRVAVVGVSAGAPYALACGWALAERVSSLAAVSPLGPSGGEGGSGGLRYRIALAPFMLAGIGPGLAELCLHTARLHAGTEARVMIEDLLVCRRPWGFDAADIRAPVHIWHGRVDRLVPLAHALKLAATIPACTALVDPTGGHFFYSRRLADILEPLGEKATCGAPHFQYHLSGAESGAPDP